MNDSIDVTYEKFILRKELQLPRHPDGYCVWVDSADEMDVMWVNMDGQLHKLSGPAYISKKFNIEDWYLNGKLHREDGPARRHRNNLQWWKNGELHRLDGPAIITLGGPKEYWMNGAKYSPKQYRTEIKRMARKGLINARKSKKNINKNS